MEKTDKPANGKSHEGKSANGKVVFDPKAFLATVNHGRTVSDYRKDDVVFLQASPADAVFYIQKGRIKIVVDVHSRARKRWSRSSGRASSSARAA